MIGMKECMDSNDCTEGLEWEILRNSLLKIGVKRHIDDLETRRQQQKDVSKNKNEKSSESTINVTGNAECNANESEESIEVGIGQVIDLDGKTRMIDDELARGSTCSRSGNAV